MIPTRKPNRLSFDLPPLPISGERRPRRSGGRILTYVLILALALGFFGYVGWAAYNYTRVGADLIGIENGVHLKPSDEEGLEVGIRLNPENRIEEAQLLVNGGPALEDLGVDDANVHRWLVPRFEEGRYELTMAVTRPILGETTLRWSYTIDGTKPKLEVKAPGTVEMGAEVRIPGRVDEEVVLTVNGEETEVDGDGTFDLVYEAPPLGRVCIEAVDLADNSAGTCLRIPVRYPEVRAVHVSAGGWADDGIRGQVLELIDSGRINTVELDVKDETGTIGYDSDVELANEIGADSDFYDPEEALDLLHDRGVHVIGRLVTFRDQALAEWANEANRMDLLVQGTDGQPLDIYRGGFTNFAHPVVQEYNIDLAVEAAQLGFDDIMFDYLRRPDGYLADMVIPGIDGDDDARTDQVEETVLSFLERTHELLRDEGVYQGAAVFGISAKRGDQIGQNAGRMVDHLDYLSPMLYPSHFGPGEYGIPDPNAAPGPIVEASLGEFVEVVGPSGVPIVPWLQDFTLSGAPYGEPAVRAQIDASRRLGADGFLLWNATVTYTDSALDGG